MPSCAIARRSLLAAPLFAALATPALAACAPPRVLFVCPAGTVKSAIARETLRRQARARGITVDALSRGVDPADHVSPELAAHLHADGLNPAADPVQRFTPQDARTADIVIAFDEAVSAPGLERARVWTTPSWNSDYAGAKAALAPQVEALLDELAGRCAAAK